MSQDSAPEMKSSPTLGEHIRTALRRSHAWRPTSFYLLLAVPVVLYLGADMFRHPDDPYRFALGLGMLFIFFGVLLLRAVLDIFEIVRKRMHAENDNWRKTLGEQDFINELGDRVKNQRKKP